MTPASERVLPRSKPDRSAAAREFGQIAAKRWGRARELKLRETRADRAQTVEDFLRAASRAGRRFDAEQSSCWCRLSRPRDCLVRRSVLRNARKLMPVLRSLPVNAFRRHPEIVI